MTSKEYGNILIKGMSSRKIGLSDEHHMICISDECFQATDESIRMMNYAQGMDNMTSGTVPIIICKLKILSSVNILKCSCVFPVLIVIFSSVLNFMKKCQDSSDQKKLKLVFIYFCLLICLIMLNFIIHLRLNHLYCWVISTLDY